MTYQINTRTRRVQCRKCATVFSTKAYNAKWCKACVGTGRKAKKAKREAIGSREVRPHPTVMLFQRVWPAVKNCARITGSAPEALRRLDVLLRGIPEAERDGAGIVRWSVRHRFATVNADLVGGPMHVSQAQKNARRARRSARLGQRGQGRKAV